MITKEYSFERSATGWTVIVTSVSSSTWRVTETILLLIEIKSEDFFQITVLFSVPVTLTVNSIVLPYLTALGPETEIEISFLIEEELGIEELELLEEGSEVEILEEELDEELEELVVWLLQDAVSYTHLRAHETDQ
mgnify:CR=1